MIFRARQAFSLVEVVIAIGIFALAVSAILGLFGPLNRSVADVGHTMQAARLADAINVELMRIRDSLAPDAESGLKLTSLNQLLNEGPIICVGSADGTRVVRLSEAGLPITGIPPGIAPRDRFFLIEIRKQPDTIPGSDLPNPLAFRDVFLAVSATVSWPYQVPRGPQPDDADEADPAARQFVKFNYALGPG
jgi:prepilin-type N-terminal cleavage/methylation domain-containing protein